MPLSDVLHASSLLVQFVYIRRTVLLYLVRFFGNFINQRDPAISWQQNSRFMHIVCAAIAGEEQLQESI
jgi:hypothetical protein